METLPKKPRLLIIEDNADTRQIYRDVFERDGFQVLVAEDGEKGLSYAQSTLPDIILLDLMLPKLSGFSVLALLQENETTKQIPVMIFSALGDEARRQKASDLGVTEYSIKAVNSPKQTVARVRALMTKFLVPTPGAALAPPTLIAATLKLSATDLARLQTDIGFKEGFRCSACGSDMTVTLLPDPARNGGHAFTAEFVCSDCKKIF